MLDKLSALRPDLLSQVRHVCVLQPSLGRDNSFEVYELPAILKLLPGLCLDRLTAIYTTDSFWPRPHGALDLLLSQSSGWKELHLACCRVDKALWRLILQQVGERWPIWSEMLPARDGLAAAPSLTAYRLKNVVPDFRILKPAFREMFEPPSRDSPSFQELEYDAFLPIPHLFS